MSDRHNGFGPSPGKFSSSYNRALDSTRAVLAKQPPGAGFEAVKVRGCQPRAVVDGLREEPPAPSLVKSPARCAECGSGFQSPSGEVSGPCRICGGELVHLVNFRTEDLDDAHTRLAESDA